MKNNKLSEVGEIINLAPPLAKKRGRSKREAAEAYYRKHWRDHRSLQGLTKTQILLDMIARGEFPRYLIREITDPRVKTAAIIERLVQDTFMRVEHLNEIAKSRPELVIPIARRQIVWPGFISRKRAFQKENAKLMVRIELGRNSNYSDREWRPDAAATRGAHWVYSWGELRKAEWGLPKLTRKNKRTWFDKAWRCMLRDLHVTPENDPHLGSLGKSAKRHYKREDPKERMPLAVRAEIKRQIWKAFDTLILPNK